MPYKEDIKIILKLLRGTSSQRKMAESLNISPSQYNRWEQCKNDIDWSTFADIVMINNESFAQEIDTLFSLMGLSLKESGFIIKKVIKMEGMSVKDAALKANITESKLERIIHGETRLTLSLFLNILSSCTSLKSDFLSIFGIEKERHNPDFNGITPVTILLLGLLSSKEYLNCKTNHAKFISDRLGLSITEVNRMIKRALNNKLIIESEEGTLIPSHHKNDFSGDFTFSSKIAKYLTSLALKRFNTDSSCPIPSKDNSNILAHRTITVSNAGSRKIIDAFLAFYGEVSKIVENDKKNKGHNEVKTLLIHFFSPLQVVKK